VEAIRKINEPVGSLLACYTKKEVEDMMEKTTFNMFTVEIDSTVIYKLKSEKADF
jgi:hypothetical protein